MIDTQTFNPQLQREHLMNLREEALASFYIATSLAGLGMVFFTFSAPDLWQVGMIGLALMFLPLLVRQLVRGPYQAQAWFLVVLWVGAVIATVYWLQNAALLALLVFPILLALLLLSTLAAVAVALAAVALVAYGARLVAPALVIDWASLLLLYWGALGITRLALQPIYTSLDWSVKHYQESRQELNEARAAQVELKQAVKDLADASTQMARLNQLLSTARQAAEEAERAKAEFVANVSHELRTPLNMIIGFSEMMINSSKLYGRIPKALLADLAVILRNSQHLSELINDVLDLSQIEAGKMALSRDQVQLNAVVEAAAVAIRPLFETKKLYLNIDIPAELVVTCDRTRIREVLLNLLSNAGRFVEQGGVDVRARVEADQVVISVADTGPGISDHDQARLFQPFQQADGSIRRRYGGTGLGLSISRHFVDLHGGRMWLESEVGVGTTIHFSLPLPQTTAPPRAYDRWNVAEWEYRQRTRRWMAPRLKVNPRLVLVEKGSQFQRLLHRYLNDVDVVSVKDLDEAAGEFAQSGAQALLVNSFDIDQTINQMWDRNLLPPGIPGVVCGMHGGEEEAAKNLGAEAYLVKPVSQSDLLGALERLEITAGTVLIVDDERDAIQLFWRMLASSGRGYRVLTASNGVEAMSVLNSESLDVILLDLTMPTMDGFQFLAWLREQPAWQDLPVIIMSARDPEGHPIAASSIGITRGGGLTISQVITFLETVCGQMQVTQPSGGSPSPADRSD